MWAWYNGVNGDVDISNSGHDFSVVGNVSLSGTTQNGHEVFRFNVGATNTGYLTTSATPVLKHAFFAMQMREATFSNYAGIITGDTAAGSVAMASGDSGTTKFYDHALGVSYRKNGVAFADANMQAPMNTFGICHWYKSAGIGLINAQIGKDRDFAGRFAEMNVGEIILCDEEIPATDYADLEQFLINKWGVT